MRDASLQPEQFDKLRLIEADHGLPVDNRYRRALKTLIEQLFQRRFVGANIFLHELNALLR